MKAAVVPAVNAPWEIREIPTPRPGPGEVLIRVHASGICGNDVWLTRGVFPFPPIDPTVVGHEPAGEVVEVGPGVTSRHVGDRVGATWIQDTCGRCDYCKLNLPLTGQSGMNCAAAAMTGITRAGGHAEYIAVPAHSTVAIPGGVSYELAAPVLCAGYTAWSAIRAGDPRPHERVAVLGIGGLGHLAVQYSRACGFETIAMTHTPEKGDLARKLGADIVVADGKQLRDAGGADVIVATGISYPAAADAMQGLRINGRMVLATIDPAGSFTIDPGQQFFAKGQRVLGTSHDGLRYLVEALDFVADGLVAPMVEVFGTDQITEAVDRVASGDIRFRAVVNY